jgi:hypothetical protein
MDHWDILVSGVNGTSGTSGTAGSGGGGTGTSGTSGTTGSPGQGVATGGTSGQILSKIDGTDYNTQWINAPSGGSSVSTTPINIVIPPKSGYIVSPTVTAGPLVTGTASMNRLTLIPFIPNYTITSSELSIFVVTASTGALARILIFSDVNGVPDTKLYESASLNCSTTGIKATTTSFTFNSGTIYWLGVHSNQSGASYRAFTPASLVSISYASVGGLANVIWIVMNYALGSLPNQIDFVAEGGLAQSNTAAVWITVA